MVAAAAAAGGGQDEGARAVAEPGWPRLTAQKGTEPRSPGWVETDGPTGREECSGATHRDSERSDLGKRPSPSCRYSRGERHLAFLGGCSTGECRLALGASTTMYRQTEDSTYQQLASQPEHARRSMARRIAEDTVAAYFGLSPNETVY